MSDRDIRIPDQGQDPVNKDSTRYEDRASKNTAKPDNVRVKGETRHVHEFDDVDELDDDD
jgi:hypothetical protein